jgi:hypothetical protein
MDLIVKKASSLTSEEKIALGINGIPDNWPVESYPYTGTVPSGFEQMTDSALEALKANNQAAYDAWVAPMHPVINLPPESVTVSNLPIPNPKTTDERDIITNNRIPLGYTIYPTGSSDNITNGTYGDGQAIKLDANNPLAVFQSIGHWYGIGGRIIWENATLDDYLNATLYAPATTGLTNTQGNFTKVEIIPSSGMHIILPTPPGQGDWSMDLTATLNANVGILKAAPVPAEGNTGYFNYDSDNNVLTPAAGDGSHNLYDFDIPLFKFANKIWGRKDNGESHLETTDVVGKLLFNSWKIAFTLSVTTPGARCGGIITTAVKRNV